MGYLQIWYIPFFREQTFNDSDAHPSGQLILKPAKYGRPDGKNLMISLHGFQVLSEIGI